MNLKTFEFTDDEKLYLLTGVARLQAIDTLCNFRFQILNKDGSERYSMGTTNLWIPESLTQKLQETLLEETKGRIMMTSEIVVIQAYDFKEARAKTLKEAIVAFLVKNWFLRIDNNWAFSYKFRDQVRCILVGD